MLIEIAGQQWSVEKIDAHQPGLTVDGTACRGATWCGQAKIYLSNELKGDQVMRVILHELTHAYICSTQAINTESWTEEDVCDLVAIYGNDIVVLARAVHRSLYPEVHMRDYLEAYKEPRI